MPLSPQRLLSLARWWTFLALVLFSAAHAQSVPAQAWRQGLTKQEVINALGEPEGTMPSGNTERMIFKGGLLVVVANNQVTDIEGPLPEALKPKLASAPVATPPATLTQTPIVPTAPAPRPANPAPVAASATPAAAAKPSGDQESEKIINDFSTNSIVPQGTSLSGVITKALGPGSEGADAAAGAAGTGALPKGLAALVGAADAPVGNKSPWSTIGTWQWFVAGLFLKTLIMTAVLKAAFAYKEFPVLWREAAFVALGVSLCNQGLAWMFSLNDFGKIAGEVQADQLVAGAVLLGLIMNFTAAKQFPTAVGIMISAMTANIAVGYAQLFFF